MLHGHFWLTGAVVLALLTPACAANTTPDEDDDSNKNFFPGFRFSRELSVSGEAPAGYSLAVTFDHEALVNDGKAESDGSDLRVFHQDGTRVTELDRILDGASSWNTSKTRIWFAAREGTGRYYVVYGSNNPGPVLEDPENVFLQYDSFDSTTLASAWITTPVGNATGDIIALGSRIRINATADPLEQTSDSLFFLFRAIPDTGDYAVELSISDAGGELADDARLGGVMIRQSTAADSKYAAVTLRNLPRAAVVGSRSTDGAMIAEAESLAPGNFPQVVGIQRTGGNLFDAFYAPDGVTFAKVGSTALLNAVTEPLLVGIPVTNGSMAGPGYAEVDWFRVRRLVVPEPTVEVGNESVN